MMSWFEPCCSIPRTRARRLRSSIVRSTAVPLLVLWIFSGCDVPSHVSEPLSKPLEGAEKTYSLLVELSGWSEVKGRCRVAAYRSAQGFNNPDHAVAKEVLAIEGELASWSVPIPESWFDSGEVLELAITAYQDRNDNGQLDKNLLGIPTEVYGFSNEAKRGFGPPTFAQAAVSLKREQLSAEATHVLEIKLR